MHAVVVGGFAENLGSLEKIAEAAVDSGVAHDADIFSMREALGGREFSFLARSNRSWMITHSAGALAVPKHVEISAVSLVAPPEPTKIFTLALSALKRTRNHFFKPVVTKRAEHIRVVAGNTGELTLPHALLGNVKHLPKIKNFSTLQMVTSEKLISKNVGYFVMEEDEFFCSHPYYAQTSNGAELHIVGATYSKKIAGGHDQILLDPEDVLSQISDTQKLLDK